MLFSLSFYTSAWTFPWLHTTIVLSISKLIFLSYLLQQVKCCEHNTNFRLTVGYNSEEYKFLVYASYYENKHSLTKTLTMTKVCRWQSEVQSFVFCIYTAFCKPLPLRLIFLFTRDRIFILSEVLFFLIYFVCIFS